MQPHRKILIAGLGNPLSGDDGFGTRVLAKLQENNSGAVSGVALADAHTDLLNYLEVFSDYEQIVVVDAILDVDGKLGPVGSIAIFEEETFSTWPETSPGVHQISPLLTLKLFRILHPQSRSRINVVGLLVDRIYGSPCYATDARVAEATQIVLSMIR